MDDDEDFEENFFEVCGSCGDDWVFINCKIKCDYVKKCVIFDGIKYLCKVGDKFFLCGGFVVCGWVSCFFGSGIWWCNDYKECYILGSYNSIVNGV